MLIKDLKICEEFIAGDQVRLHELLHPDKQDINLQYSLAHAIVKPGQASQAHKLSSSEVYYILDGEGVMVIEDESAPVHAGQVIYVPPNATQYIQNTGTRDLIFLCIVEPAWRPAVEEVVAK